MRINADFSKRVVVRPGDVEWVQSPSHGVDRMMLDRIGDEVARATTIVRYAPNSHFPEHEHSGGEEFLILEGVFSDETGDFPTGTYVRNPIGTSHAPHTEDGCTILVKLRQFDEQDTELKRIYTATETFQPGLVDGLSVLALHEVPNETVALVRWQPGTHFSQHTHWGGEEIFVLEGTFQDEHGDYPKGTWLRSPHLSQHTPFSDEGCLIYVKTGHLAEMI
jgi:anti-sigma factor ChrR (cupin superfamily)